MVTDWIVKGAILCFSHTNDEVIKNQNQRLLLFEVSSDSVSLNMFFLFLLSVVLPASLFLIQSKRHGNHNAPKQLVIRKAKANKQGILFSKIGKNHTAKYCKAPRNTASNRRLPLSPSELCFTAHKDATSPREAGIGSCRHLPQRDHGRAAGC